MAKLSAIREYWTPVAVANTTNMTAAGFHCLKGGTTTQMNLVQDIVLGGAATSSAPCNLIVARDATVQSGVTSNAALLSWLSPASADLAAMPVTADVGSTTLPQRSATAHLLAPVFNAFGGAVRWSAAVGEEIVLIGNANPATGLAGEISISHGSSGTPGLLSSTIIFEPV